MQSLSNKKSNAAQYNRVVYRGVCLYHADYINETVGETINIPK